MVACPAQSCPANLDLTMRPQDLLRPTPAGLYCSPGDFYIDPVRPVDRAVITHGHSDHARAGHGAVLATTETLATVSYTHLTLPTILLV